MKNLIIESTKITPKVNFNLNGDLKIEGRSIPEDPESFFKPLFDWIQEYFKTTTSNTKLDVQLEYVNSGSSKFILSFMKIFKENHAKGCNCIINWIYEEDDENVLELGMHYKSLLNIPFNLVEIF